MSPAYVSLPNFSREEAFELLQIHSFTYHNTDDPRMENGFLGSLRPYRGSLNHHAFHELMACIKTLGPEMSGGDTLDRQVISNLWGICQLARAWAVYPDGMLRSNSLINDADINTMEEWLDCISYSVMMFLECPDALYAFEPYEHLIEQYGYNST